MANKEDDDATRQVRQINPQQRPVGGGSNADQTRIAQPRRPEPPETIIHSPGSQGHSEGHTVIHRRIPADQPGQEASQPVTGWLVATAGPGRGKARSIFDGMNSVGRDSSQRIPLDFGDQEISGKGHFFITFEPKKRSFHIHIGDKVNLVYLNGEVVLGPMTLTDGDELEVGQTKLRFVPLCGPRFSWDEA
jgi:hypothetical protein